MNEHIDPAFAPVDEIARPKVGHNPDGTVTYEIVEGKEYHNGVEVKKEPLEIVGYVQTEDRD